MDITPTRLNALISEALTPQPAPLPKADPATTALIKTLVQPPAPPSAQAAQFAAHTLTNSLQVPPARPSQRTASSPVEDAYRAMMEPDTDAQDTPGRTPQDGPVSDADHGPRANGTALPLVSGSAAGAAPATQPTSSIAAGVFSSPGLIAANANAPQAHGVGGRPAGHAPRSDSVPVSLWTISIVTAVVSAVTATIMVLLLR